MFKNFWQGCCLLMLLHCTTAYTWAMPVSSEKIKAYAEIYPDIMEASMLKVAYQKNVNKKEYAVKLLLESFNGNTDVDELYSALGSTYNASKDLEEERIKMLLSSRNIQWQEYKEINSKLSNDPDFLKTFVNALDKTRVKSHLEGMTDNQADTTNQVAIEHNLIMKSLIADFFKK